MAEQSGWTRVFTPHGRYEYQFQGSGPTVRSGQYLDAKDYQFLVMDEEGWLYRIPVRVAAEAEAELKSAEEAATLAAAQLCAGLAHFRPQQNAPYDELDQIFAVDLPRLRELRKNT